MSNYEENTKEIVDSFIEQMGMITQSEGLPRIAGKIIGLLLIESGPFSFSDIAARLQISRGSVSTNTRLLENLSVIERVSKLGERGDFFQMSQDPYMKLLQGSMQRMSKASQTIKEARNALPDSWQASQKRLEALEQFYTEYLKSTQKLIKTLYSKE
ncbi:GbsR/MarR family transcriptional regulator [Marinomonas algarum]|uniref:HTH-type transcriptional regulator n=1 Tax=Marinomonas algarum TaxID=2883105 RepID=A0A9X1IMT1_9GAMM|nr:hypothetical protein [Marinomonas algarum]MCB5161689.1 hypothetical protein [Marinomonas algarum]